MADPVDIPDPYAPIPVPQDPRLADDFMRSWASLDAYAPPPEPAPIPAPVEATPQLPPVQPGIGVPTQTLDALPQPEIEMPAEYVGKGPPEVDAISGVDALPPPPPEEPSPFVEAAPHEPSPFFDAMDPRTWANSLGEQDLDEMSRRDPEGYARYVAAHEAARQTVGRDAQQAANDQLTRDLERANQDRMDVLAESEKRRQKLLETEVDPGRHMRQMSAPQTIAAYLSVIVGGLVQGRRGGSNMGLDMLERAIDRDIQAQRDNISNQRSALADFERAGLSKVEAQEAYRIGVYKQAIAGIQTKMQDYDPQGSTAISLVQQRRELEGRAAQAAEAARRAYVKEQLDIREQVRKEAETASKLRGEQADYLVKMKKLSGGGVSADKIPQSPDYFKAMYPNAPVPPRAMTEKEYSSWISTTKAGAEATQALGAETAEQHRTRELGVGMPDGTPFVNADGKPFTARNPAVAEKLTKQANAAREVADIIDEVLAIRERSGGESKLWNSDDRQRLDVLQNRLVILEKGGTEGMSSDEDMKKLSNAIGAGDVASFRARTAGLAKGRERTVGFLNQTLRANQYTGKPVTVPNRFNLPKPKPTEREEDLQTIIKSEYSTPETDPAAFLAGKSSADPLSEDSPDNIDILLAKLAGRARHGDQSAWKDIETISETAVSPILRNKAAALLVERPK